MKKHLTKNRLRMISICLIAVLLITGIFRVMPEHTVIPDNPLITEVASLSADISMQSGASSTQESTDEVTGNESEEPEEEK